MHNLTDYSQRQQAIDPKRSFIVQAPAGSGKTELLTQRLLALLTTVDKPEQILAITFTRKAAEEMRERILKKLQLAQNSTEPSEEWLRQTWSLASKALARDQQLQWQLLNNPNRLRIQTIDSLCASLTRQLPLTAQLGSNAQVNQDPYELYQHAAEELLHNSLQDGQLQTAITSLLEHLDNQLPRLQRLICDMLSIRDQWLPHIVQTHNQIEARQDLEKALLHLSETAIEQLQHVFPGEHFPELIALLQFSSTHSEAMQSQLAPFNLNDPDLSHDINFWQTACQLLFTQAGLWRSQITHKIGFPAVSSAQDKDAKSLYQAMKQRLQTLIAELQEIPELQAALQTILLTPAPFYDEQQWQTVAALLQLLPLACAHLRTVFARFQQVDFIEIAQAAQTALGEFEQPSDLALALDYQIQHILVDEFQDTSIPQLRLLEKLTAGWEDCDGRSLFLVGDPMQSIYRFRNAEVGLFVHVSEHGLNQLPLTYLQLNSNFRSSANIVNWINQSFTDIFPAHSDEYSGAIRYSQAHAIHGEEAETAVNTLLCADDETEAVMIAEVVKSHLTNDSDSNLAILVQARHHLSAIIPALQRANIDFQAVAIESLQEQTIIQDLLALTRALLHPADRIAWLACLRAPWCGLTLTSLKTIADAPDSSTIWQALSHVELAATEQQRLQHLQQAFEQAFVLEQRLPLSIWVKLTWQLLHGDQYITAIEHQHADTFFELIAELEAANGELSSQQLEYKLSLLFAKHAKNQSRVHIMTIHKAKGLEFDTVIVPAIETSKRQAKTRLLTWLERPFENDIDLLLAPIKAAQHSHDPIARYIQSINHEKDLQEFRRLLYVAATRAKKQLYFTGVLDSEAPDKRSAHSFLSFLWQSVAPGIQWCDTMASADGEIKSQLLQRLPSSQLQTEVTLNPLPENPFDFSHNSYQINQPAIIGTLVHRTLQQISEDGIEHWSTERLQVQQSVWQVALQQAGFTQQDIDTAITTMTTAIDNTLNDDKGRWILQSHPEAYSELAVTIKLNNRPHKLIIDRSFVDETGQAWIIDYKTANTTRDDLAQFINTETARYQQQLHRYQQALIHIYPQPIRLALYFPLLQLWVEITA